MYHYEFTSKSFKELSKLPPATRGQIIKKIDFFLSSNCPLDYAERLINNRLGEYRFRIGDYRVVFDLEVDTLVIHAVAHRRDIYRG